MAQKSADPPCVERIPDAAYVRRELSRNLRERELLSKLLRLAERKATLIDSDDDSDCRSTRQGVSHV